MRVITKFTWLFIIEASTHGCFQGATESRLAIVGGEDPSHEASERAVMISIDDPEFGSVPLCSGVLLRSGSVLSTAHCFKGLVPEEIVVSPIPSHNEPTSQRVDRFQWFVMGSSGVQLSAQRPTGLESKYDLVLLTLAATEDARNLPLLGSVSIDRAQEGDLAIILGFGRRIASGCASTSPGCVGVLQQIWGSIDSSQVDPSRRTELAELRTPVGTGACDSDSGAGIFTGNEPSIQLVGVVFGDVSASQNPCSNGRTAFIRLDFWTQKQWEVAVGL